MAAKLVQTWLKRFSFPTPKHATGGMTLIELLVSIIISSIIITVLLNFVVDLLKNERQDFARNETQRDMQMAMDFIVSDLREAVYVYENEQLQEDRGNVPALKTFLNIIPSGAEPVLAFWKLEPLPNDKVPSSCPGYNEPPLTSTAAGRECNLLRVKRRTYSLVVYMQQKQDPNASSNSPWNGKARILRYQAQKYNMFRLPDTLERSPGYVDPTVPGEGTNFQNWPYTEEGTNLRQGSFQGSPSVLVDFVDNPERPNNVPETAMNCPNPTGTTPNPDYSRVPANTTNFTNFFVCVRKRDSLVADRSMNQDVIIFLRGNPASRDVAGTTPPLTTLKTQAVARGVVDKEPQ